MRAALMEHAMFNRKKIAMDALKASIAARKRAGCDLVSPISIYDVCASLRVSVRFVDISMEGMYDRVPKPRIHISALRPLVRRNLTCAHELGHHWFGHGSTIDELRENSDGNDYDNPIEFVANQFAYFMMMPTLGVRNALATRQIDLERATPKQIFAVSSSFGVGYETLLNHLRYGITALPDASFRRLRLSDPKTIKADVLGSDVADPLVLVDSHWALKTLDLETGDFVVLPGKLALAPKQLNFISMVGDGAAYRAVDTGLARLEIPTLPAGTFLRIARKSVVKGKSIGYVGLAQYRHLEDQSDD